MQAEISVFVNLGVFIYMLTILGIGLWASRRIKNISDFLVAGRRLSYPLATATLFATWFGAGSCMGAAGTAYGEGILGVVSDPFAAGVALILAGCFYVALLRRLELLTITDIFGRYYSKNTEIFASLLMVPVYIGWLGAQMVALGFLCKALLGIDPTLGIAIGTLIVIMYTFAGGMWAVTVADFVQITVLILGVLILFPVVIHHAGGLGSLVESTPKHFWYFFPHNAGFKEWMAYAGQWGLLGLGTIVGQDLIQRSLSSKNEKVAKNSAVTAGILYIIVGCFIILLGFAGRLILPNLENPELVLPTLAIRFLPPLLLIVFISALVGAITSSADSSLLAATSLLTNNVILKLSPSLGGKDILRLTRIATIFVALLSMFVALYVKQIYALMVNSWATLLVAILVPVTAALYWKKANNAAAWISMVSGTATWLCYILINTGNIQEISDPLFYRAAAYGGVVSMLSYVTITLVRYNKIKAIKLPSEYPEK